MSKKNWHFHIHNEIAGPFSTEVILTMLRQNRLQFVDYIWAEHLTKWYRILDLDEFAQELPSYPKIPVPRAENNSPEISPKKISELSSSNSIQSEPSQLPPQILPENPSAESRPSRKAPKVEKKQESPPKKWPKIRRFVRIDGEGVFVEMEVFGRVVPINLSEGGFFIKAKKCPEVGTEFQFTLELKSLDKKFKMTGVVIRHGQVEGVDGFALEFIRMNPAHRRAIQDFVNNKVDS